jgi:predicted nuclease of predicted toxin-antitoxin system
LRNLDYDAVHLSEQNLNRLPDSEILNKARTESRIILAHDLDFTDLLAAAGLSLPSVIIFRLRRMRPERVQHYLQTVIDQHARELDRGAIVSVTEGRIRIRLLPIAGQGSEQT